MTRSVVLSLLIVFGPTPTLGAQERIDRAMVANIRAEGVGVDAEGNVYGAVVRRRMLEKHVRR